MLVITMKEKIIILSSLFLTVMCQDSIKQICYGQVMDSRCEPGKVILPTNVIASARNVSSSCPLFNNDTTSPCCEINVDCVGTYKDTDNSSESYIYHEKCIGRNQCEPVSMRRTKTSSLEDCQNINEHVNETTQLAMVYECLNESGIVIMTDNISIQDTSTDLWYKPYDSSAATGVAPNNCSIETTSCSDVITLGVVDVRLGSETIIIGNDYEQAVLTKSNIINFNPVEGFFTSRYHYLTIRVLNYDSIVNSQFWIRFNSSSMLSLRCPSVPSTLNCQRSSVSVCEDSFAVTCDDYNILTVTLIMIIVFLSIFSMLAWLVTPRFQTSCCVKEKETPSVCTKQIHLNMKDNTSIAKDIINNFAIKGKKQ